MKQDKLEDLFDYLPKSKIKAGDGLEEGKYPFYTSSENQSKYLNDFQHGPGCLVFGTGGKASVHLTTSHFATSTDCITIKPKPNSGIDAGYVFQYFKGNMQVLENGFKGAGLKHISKAYLSAVVIPHPEEIGDQRRIANLLSKVERLITQRKQHLQKLDDMLKSVFLEIFGDPVRNEKGWEKNTAINYADCIVPGRDKPKSFTGETPWVTTGDLQQLGYTAKSRGGIGLTDIEIKEVRARVVPKSSVLLTCVGDLGVVSICTTDMVINQQLHAFQVSEDMTEEFFMYSLSYQKRYMYQNASQTTIPYMNKTVCNRTPMIRPPKDLQIKFAETVRVVHRIKSQYQKSLTDLEALYSALSQQAFKGKLDLSRVPMPGILAVEEKAMASVPLNTPVEQSPDINLPDTDNLLSAIGSAEMRKGLITQWLEAYRDQLGNRPFLVKHFMDTAQTRIAELHPDNDIALGANDYEDIKNWVFAALANGRLQQMRNITHYDAKGESVFGNLIELKAVQA